MRSPQYRTDAGRGDHPYAQGFYAAMDNYDKQKRYKNPYNKETESEAYSLWENGDETFISCCLPLDYEDTRC